MKINKNTIWSFILLVVIASLYRVMPNRPGGFAPQIAMAIFAGSIIKEKQYSFLLPLLSMFVSDALYEVLYKSSATQISGFYDGQITNYILFGSLTVVGFFINKQKIAQIIGGSLVSTTIYFLVSNFLVWMNGTGINNLPYAKTWAGITECYTVAIPFYLNSIYATLFFSGLLFGSYYLINKFAERKLVA